MQAILKGFPFTVDKGRGRRGMGTSLGIDAASIKLLCKLESGAPEVPHPLAMLFLDIILDIVDWK